jgi:hypothetical protein
MMEEIGFFCDVVPGGTYSDHWAVKGYCFVIRNSQLMFCIEIFAVCSQINTKHLNTLCGQKVEFL